MLSFSAFFVCQPLPLLTACTRLNLMECRSFFTNRQQWHCDCATPTLDTLRTHCITFNILQRKKWTNNVKNNGFEELIKRKRYGKLRRKGAQLWRELKMKFDLIRSFVDHKPVIQWDFFWFTHWYGHLQWNARAYFYTWPSIRESFDAFAVLRISIFQRETALIQISSVLSNLSDSPQGKMKWHFGCSIFEWRFQWFYCKIRPCTFEFSLCQFL